jgi:hypothetical protein
MMRALDLNAILVQKIGFRQRFVDEISFIFPAAEDAPLPSTQDWPLAG